MPSRCFVSVELPQAALELLGEARLAFLDAAPAWAREKWVRPELLHLTLKFAGALPDAAVDDALCALADACAALPAFSLALAGVSAAPSAGRAQMLWATFTGDLEACADLARGVDVALAKGFGVPSDERPFRPHSTLARARRHRRAPGDAIAAAETCIAAGKETDRVVSVRSVTLVSSTLGPGGPVYETLGTVPLRG